MPPAADPVRTEPVSEADVCINFFGFKVSDSTMTPQLIKLQRAKDIATQNFPSVGNILRQGQFFEELPNFDMSVKILRFPRKKFSNGSVIFGYTADWVEDNSESDIALHIVEQVQDAIASERLPQLVDEFSFE